MVAPSSLMRTQLSLNRLLHSPLFTQIIHHRAPNPSIHRHHGDLPGWLSNRVQRHPFARSRVFSSPFSSSSSSKKKEVGVGLGRNGVGFIAWYLGMVKSRPVLTKSFTCSIIYTAADLSFSGENGGEIIARSKRDFVPTLVNGAMYWPLCDFITFRFIPVHLQPLVSNSLSYLWTVYMTYISSLEKASPE